MLQQAVALRVAVDCWLLPQCADGWVYNMLSRYVQLDRSDCPDTSDGVIISVP
jgi:hypothetical protein